MLLKLTWYPLPLFQVLSSLGKSSQHFLRESRKRKTPGLVNISSPCAIVLHNINTILYYDVAFICGGGLVVGWSPKRPALSRPFGFRSPQ